MIRNFYFSLLCLVATNSEAQLLVAHLPYVYENNFIDAPTVAPYYYKAVLKGDYTIILNVDNNTLLFPRGDLNPSEQHVSKIKFDAASRIYTCTDEDPGNVKWRGYIFHLNPENDPDYVMIQEINKGKDSKRDTIFILYTKSLADVHITERYNLVKTINNFTESRERYNFYHLMDKQEVSHSDNLIIIKDGLINIKSGDKKGEYSDLQLKITNAEIRNTTVSKGIVFNGTSTNGSNKKYELFYGSYAGMKGESYKTGSYMMYIRELINGEPLNVQLMF